MLNHPRVGREMETNPAKQYLMEYRALVQRRDALLDELDRLREATLRATGRISAVPPSGTRNPGATEDALLRVVEGETRLMQIIAHLKEALSVRLALIEQLPDEREKTLLTLRYIKGYDWEHVGYALHYERTRVFELHQHALEGIRLLMAHTPEETDSATTDAESIAGDGYAVSNASCVMCHERFDPTMEHNGNGTMGLRQACTAKPGD